MKNLRKTRKEKGYTCESLGKLVGVGKSTMAKYERGDIQPSNEVLLKLASILDCTTDYLLGRTDDPAPTDLVIPDELKGVKVAFPGSAFEGLTQDEVDILATIAESLKEKRQGSDRKK